MRYNTILNSEAGLITGDLYQMPCRWFLPEGLFQTSCDSNNMHYVGANNSTLTGAAIGTNLRSAINSTIGEFCERYCAAQESAGQLVKATYEEMVARHGTGAVLLPAAYSLYADWQYAQPNFPYRRCQPDDTVAWVQGRNLLSGLPMWVPAYLVYLPHDDIYYDQGVKYTLYTSTGFATGRTVGQAVQGGFLECAERHAFSTFWYNQLTLPPVPTYAAETIVQAYPEEEWIKRLYANPRVKIRAFDLGGLGSVETIVVFMSYVYKGQERLSVGAASRFRKPEAMIKAALEAYQCIEYHIAHDKQDEEWTTNQVDFANVDSFHKHALLYNRFPELRTQVPILNHLRESASATSIHEYKGPERMHTMEEVQRTGLEYLIAVEVTTADVRDMGLHVVRVLTPGWAYLTGMHDRPFLGAPVFNDRDKLFTHMPHPFP